MLVSVFRAGVLFHVALVSPTPWRPRLTSQPRERSLEGAHSLPVRPSVREKVVASTHKGGGGELRQATRGSISLLGVCRGLSLRALHVQ